MTNNADRIFKKRYKIALDETSNSIDIVDMNIKEESFLLNTLESILPRRPSNQSLTSKTSSMKLAHVLPFNPKFEFLEEDSCVTSKQITVELIDSPQSSIILSNTSSTNPQPTYYNVFIFL